MSEGPQGEDFVKNDSLDARIFGKKKVLLQISFWQRKGEVEQ